MDIGDPPPWKITVPGRLRESSARGRVAERLTAVAPGSTVEWRQKSPPGKKAVPMEKTRGTQIEALREQFQKHGFGR